MFKVRMITQEDANKIFNLKMALLAVEDAYLEKANGDGEDWPMIFHDFETGKSDLDVKSGNLRQKGIYGLKVVSWNVANKEKNLPDLTCTTLVFDEKTGAPIAMINAGSITGARTGAAAAIGAKYLARKNSKNMMLVGCGAQSPYVLAETLMTLPSIEEVMIVNPFMPESAEKSLTSIIDKVDSLLKESGIKRTATIGSSVDIKGTTGKSDVILTVTPSKDAMIKKEWVKAGTHFSCIGSDMVGKQEIESAIFKNALVIGDSKIQNISVGECEIPFKEGIITEIDGEIGQVINGSVKGRTSEEQITIFDSTGIALQDLSSADIIIKKCIEDGLGTLVEI
ncbi:MAG: hypothetical protein WBA54_07960 [Acidaminobacteraceae bacterium]